MYGPRVFMSMIVALLVFGLATYGLTGSLSGSLIQTLICAVLLQVGYFAGMLFLVWKEARDRKRKVDNAASPSMGADEKPASSLPVTRLNGPGGSNF
ncbi:exopolysaccharide production repressor protein [Rhizobium sp. ARZ01]|uniref:exopolysaccharide production repressor protein n=1 Tax=Rhizobium sp. ARZ01 TaxID=2769313 RepID=UPI00177FC1A7|nr:exopolysaccharide production repressor protein [Rhizobium sp. ARZ01]MBD9375306.1 exopolysaccharide production repressor protein [Rhizobium sp. ARZ01]